VRKTAQRAVIAGAGVLAIISGVGGTDLVAQAHADNPECVAGTTELCSQSADLPQPDPPRRSHVQVYCQPAGAMWGAHCVHRWVP
jgi:hypothetical protein